ncbi:membrane associated rhomboid family serine protease [Thermonema lapsum]|uniref:Membrane associated rhomboid family serine protease n=1 Tax=Thermonema lapsum TaxID=28195 RepID=A0A846MST5_9BACT|nr:rhomboid family intramembrane serine protease [Thermonema lapsum]NIK74307.1 membrane associated rhomboid family serine protease [Thermonema lapsum]
MFRSAGNSLNTSDALIRLILINVGVFLLLKTAYVFLWAAQSTHIYRWLVLHLTMPAEGKLLLQRPYTLITYFFTHESFWHILFNMLFLYWFGRILQEFLGNQRLVALYILGGLAGGLLYFFLYNVLPPLQFIRPVTMLLGASASVYAIVVGAATLRPSYTVHLLLFGPVQIRWIAIFFVLLSFIEIGSANTGGNFAHLGGSFMGYLYIKMLQRGTDLGGWINFILDKIGGLFHPKPRLKVHHPPLEKVRTHNAIRRSTNKSQEASSSLQDEIDRILDKISEQGYESLTPEEKQKLWDASRNL